MPKTNPNKLKKREKRIREQWNDGYLMKEIAILHNISVERVSQILNRPTKKLSTGNIE